MALAMKQGTCGLLVSAASRLTTLADFQVRMASCQAIAAGTTEVTTLLPITAPTPIYEAMLALATETERQIIIAGGPRELLDNNRMFGHEADHDAAMATFDAMKSILTSNT